jgi:plastocyanin
VHRELEVRRLWVAGCAATVSLVALTACAPAPGATSAAPATAGSSDSQQTGDRSSGTAGAGDTDSNCTKATKVAIVAPKSGAGDTYSFDPGKLTIQRGGFLAISNKSGAVHALVTSPDAGIVSSVLDKNERQVIQFPRTGHFTVQSADPTRRAVLRVTVSGDSGCGTPKPTLAITGTADDQYTFTPTSLTVAPTANFTVVNKSDVAQTVICTPDPGGNKDNPTLDQGETQLLAIDEPGRYGCRSIQHGTAKVTITVNGT